MNTHTGKTQENKVNPTSLGSVANILPHMQSSDESSSQFLDKRSEIVTQRKLQELANNNNPRAMQLKSLQCIVNNSSQAKQTAQLQAMANNHTMQRAQPIQKKENNTGLPDDLKTGVENLSSISLDSVRVNYNLDKPAQLNAHAYAQGSDIHIAPGQEQHLPHEAWHVVQQAQGRVQPTMQMKQNIPVNDDEGLEHEADVMGAKALQMKTLEDTNPVENNIVMPIAIQKMSQRVDKSDQKILNTKTSTVQRKITVGILKYDAEQAETRVRGTGIEWKDIYRQVLTSLDVKDQRFKNIEELTANIELNSNYLEAYKDEAAVAWTPYDWAPGTRDTLHDLAYNVIVNAITDKTAITDMSYDKVFKYTPETQLAYCLWECRDDTPDVLALCLYTSYFYEPLNKYFRGQNEPDASTDFGKLILKTAEVLRGSYESEEATPIEDKRYKLELKSGWIEDDQENINFAALTSTHPNLDGVKGMWGDVASGTFGAYDNFALLTFEGTSKTKRPMKKYFPSESEDLMAPGASYRIIDRYRIEGEIPGIGRKLIRVFRLSNIQNQDVVQNRLSFTDVV
jgi:hypothetical protein